VATAIDSKLIRFLDRSSEVLLQVQLRADCNAGKTRVGYRSLQLSLFDIFDSVVRDEMMRDTVQRDAHGLLDQSVRSKAVAIDERANKLALHLLVTVACAWRGRLGVWLIGRRWWCWRQSVVVGNFVILGITAAFGLLRGSLALHGSLLLAGREGLLEFAVDQKVSENATGTPRDTVGPTLDTWRVLFVDEDTTALDKTCSLTVVRTARDVMELAAETSFEQYKTVHTVLDEAMPCRLKRTRTRTTTTHGAYWCECVGVDIKTSTVVDKVGRYEVEAKVNPVLNSRKETLFDMN
jgi:hypothetical protein